MRKDCIPLAMAALLTACAPNSFTDRPAKLLYAAAPDDPAETERKALIAYHASSDTLRENMGQMDFRNSFVWRQIAADDDDFHRFVRNIRSDRALMNMSADTGSIVLNGLAAVTGTSGEKAALAALSGGLLATKGSVDKQLFNLETVSALLARMKAARLAALVPIRRGLVLNVMQYPLEQALVDLRSYSDAGSLLATIEAITTDAGRIAAQSEDAADVIRDVVYRDSRDTVDALRVRLNALSDDQVLALAFAMDVVKSSRPDALKTDLHSFDPAERRFLNGANARQYLHYWLEHESGAPSELDEWDKALKLAGKAKP